MIDTIIDTRPKTPPDYWIKEISELHPEQIFKNENLKNTVINTLSEMYAEKEIDKNLYQKLIEKVIEMNPESANFPDIYLQSFIATEDFKFLG